MEGYSFMALEAESLRLAPAWQETDRAFFDANPERTYTVRPAHPGEYDLLPDDADVFIVLRRSACGTIDRRPIVMVEGEPATDDETGQWLWAIWEVDDTVVGVFCSCEVVLLSKVFGYMSTDHTRALPTRSG